MLPDREDLCHYNDSEYQPDGQRFDICGIRAYARKVGRLTCVTVLLTFDVSTLVDISTEETKEHPADVTPLTP